MVCEGDEQLRGGGKELKYVLIFVSTFKMFHNFGFQGTKGI